MRRLSLHSARTHAGNPHCQSPDARATRNARTHRTGFMEATLASSHKITTHPKLGIITSNSATRRDQKRNHRAAAALHRIAVNVMWCAFPPPPYTHQVYVTHTRTCIRRVYWRQYMRAFTAPHNSTSKFTVIVFRATCYTIRKFIEFDTSCCAKLNARTVAVRRRRASSPSRKYLCVRGGIYGSRKRWRTHSRTRTRR